ncbi:MAG: response regulator [Planctomycetota bacterium]
MSNSQTSETDFVEKRVFTTGEAAQVCNVSQQTIIRCFDSGRLSGFRVPGSRFRRIPREELIRFMKSNGIPLEAISAKGKRVLLVDDDERILDLVSSILNRDGRFELRTATNGYDAGLQTAAFKPSVILLDYMLPDINGDVVLHRLRESPQSSDTKILIVSGVVRQAEIDALLEAGADGFIKKPFEPTELAARVAALAGLPSDADQTDASPDPAAGPGQVQDS